MDVVLLTPRSPGAIAVYLLAGGDCPAALRQFCGIRGPLCAGAVRRVTIKDADFAIDDALLVCVADDLYELHLHGGVAVVQAVADVLARVGGRIHDPQSDAGRQLAARGYGMEEFRKGIPAEVLTALPLAKTSTAVDLLVHQLRDGLTAWRAHWLKQLPLGKPLWQFQSEVQWLLDRSEHLRHILVPPRIAIVGPPNAGKSTLANAFMGKPVSITSEIPGTTRDWVDATGVLATLDVSIPATFLDTAGIRQTSDPIENESIRRSKMISMHADAMIVVLDGSAPRTTDTDQFLQFMSNLPPAVLTMNKSDRAGLPFQFPELVSLPRVTISALTHQGIPELIGAILQLLGVGTVKPLEPFAFTDRQRDLLHRAGIAYNSQQAIKALTQL